MKWSTEQEEKKEKSVATYGELVERVGERLLRYCGQDWWTMDAAHDARKIVDMVRNWEPKKL